jgi:hypothetical protein
MIPDIVVPSSAVALGTALQPSRRQFLKNFGRGAVAWGLAQTFNSVTSVVDVVHAQPWAQELARLNHLCEMAHPYSFIYAFRNMVIAAKLLDLEQDINIAIGKGHLALPHYCNMGEDALLNMLSLYPKQYLNAFLPDQRYLYKSLSIQQEDAKLVLRTVDHPRLRELFA